MGTFARPPSTKAMADFTDVTGHWRWRAVVDRQQIQGTTYTISRVNSKLHQDYSGFVKNIPNLAK